jgi:hypothetical protein
MLAAVRGDGRLVRAALLDGLSGSGPYGALLGFGAGVGRRSRLSIRLRRGVKVLGLCVDPRGERREFCRVSRRGQALEGAGVRWGA